MPLKEKGLIVKSASAVRVKRKRQFNKHARRWTFKQDKEIKPGERLQINLITASKNGVTVKHFQSCWRKRFFPFFPFK